MKKLFTNRGAALIILIIAITITALTGAGIASFISSKKATEDYPVYSYQAYLLAHAGVEFAIRYAHDNKEGFASSPYTYIFLYNSSNPCISSSLNTTIWKQVNLPDGFTKDNKGTLYISLEYLAGPPASYTLHACGKYGGATREIKLNNFQTFYQ